MTHRILLKTDRYGQYQIILQEKYWCWPGIVFWWGVAFYRRANMENATHIAEQLAYDYECEVIKK
jgi:hypothetical protein